MQNRDSDHQWNGPMFDPESKAGILLASRYLRKDKDGRPMETPEQLLMRVARAVADAEEQYGTPRDEIDKLAQDFFEMMAEGFFLPNSPTLMNAGCGSGSLAACYVLRVEDSIDSIFQTQYRAAKIQQLSGGTGFNLSLIRPAGDRVRSSGGTASGPVPFIGCFNAVTEAVTQAAHRRGANMAVLEVWHPDILAFVNAKRHLATLNHFNLSVGLSDDFIDAVRTRPDDHHQVRNPHTGVTSTLQSPGGRPYSCGDVFDLLARRAWETGEPGVLFMDTINAANPTPLLGPIRGVNPCGEQPLLDGESCNLGSINLAQCLRWGECVTFDAGLLIRVIRLASRFLDNVLDINNFPFAEIREMTLGNRKIGLGLMGFADTLSAQGIAYNSPEGLAFAENVAKTLQDESHKASAELAKKRGIFPNWKGSVWEQREMPMRNAAVICIAPTGSISRLVGCSSGIEPHYMVAYAHNILEGRRFVEVNPVFERIGRKEGWYSDALVRRVIERGSLQGIPEIPEHIRAAFVTAHEMSPSAHVKMQAVFQKHCDAGVSKTINLPATATVDDVKAAILWAHELKCKGITVYRDGSRPNQPLTLAAASGVKTPAQATAVPVQLPEVMPAIRVKQYTPFGTMHVKIVVDPTTKREREIFAQLGKAGDVAAADLEGMCRLGSLYLRVNGELGDVVRQLDGIGSRLSVPTKDGRVTSLADGLAKAINKYMRAKELGGIDMLLLGKTELSGLVRPAGPTGEGRTSASSNIYRVKCECGSDLVFEEGCEKCPSCGWSRC